MGISIQERLGDQEVERAGAVQWADERNQDTLEK